MNKRTSLSLIAFALSTLLFGSCIKKEIYNTTNGNNNAPVGYQYYFFDEFDTDRYGWTFSDPANNAYGLVTNSEYTFSYQAAGNGTYATTIPTNMATNRDWLIVTQIESNKAMALNFGVGNNEYGYSFFIDQTGYLAVFDEGTPNVQVSTLLDWQYAREINAGYNKIAIEQVGNRWYGYINERRVFDLPARPLYGSSVGFLNMAGTIGYADYLTVKW